MPLEPEEKKELLREVVDLIDFRIDRHHERVAMPMHTANIAVQNSFRDELKGFGNEMRALTKIVTDFFSEQRGVEKEKTRADQERKEELEELERKKQAALTTANLGIAASTKLSQWTLVLVGIIAVIVAAIGVYVTYRAVESPHNPPAVVGHNSSIPKE